MITQTRSTSPGAIDVSKRFGGHLVACDVLPETPVESATLLFVERPDFGKDRARRDGKGARFQDHRCSRTTPRAETAG
ncbi:MAG TPA: hypothetical protein VME45_06380 [Stellaceae bacterium]|nr:hypothetical protein [Stellaceae bacterium]